MEAEEIELRASRARRKLYYENKAPFGWGECLLQIRGVLTDSVWEEGELEINCQKWFEQGEDFMRGLVGLETRFQRKELEEKVEDGDRKKALAAERSRAYRERKKQEGAK